MTAAEKLPYAWQLSMQFNGALQHFCPDALPSQHEAMRLVRVEFDYSQGNLELMLSGSVGSAKSKLLAHLAVTHCLENKGGKMRMETNTDYARAYTTGRTKLAARFDLQTAV